MTRFANPGIEFGLSRKLFVHVGPRKTATTAIQHSLRRHDNSVVVYPKVGLKGPGNHHGLVHAYFGRGSTITSNRRDHTTAEKLLSKIALEARKSCLDVVISSETLELDWADVGLFIRALLPHVGCSQNDVEIIVACREHFSRAASWYNHRIRDRRGEQNIHPDEFLAETANAICYKPLIERLKETRFKVVPLSYHPSENWTDRFFRHIGFAENQIPRVAEKNRGLSTKALIAKLATNRAIRSDKKRKQYLDAFRGMSDFYGSSKFIFSRACARQVDVAFSEDRGYLLNECGIRLNPPDLGTIENAFFINPVDLEEIALAASRVGREAAQITRFAREYLRD